jgi:DNA-binding HxlR family transcriptional regulator
MIQIAKKRSECPLSGGLEILGDKWTLLIIRDLMFTNRREFGHFLQSGEGISTNILSERLERLQCYGLILKEPHPDHGKKYIYSLTDEGVKLAPTIFEFTLWASQAIDNTFMPPQILTAIKNDRAGLMKLIKKRVPLVDLDSNA